MELAFYKQYILYRIIQWRKSCVYTWLFPNKISDPLRQTSFVKLNKIIVITTFFNSQKSLLLRKNYDFFYKRLVEQGVDVLTMELAVGEDSFVLNNKNATYLVQVRSNSCLWQKERLFNLALKYVDKKYDAIVFMDADCYFKSRDWIKKTLSMLSKYHFVQTYSKRARLKRGCYSLNTLNNNKGIADGKWFHSFARGLESYGLRALGVFSLHGEVGSALAARRDSIQKIGFYDKNIVGSGDTMMLHALFDGKSKSFHYCSRQLKINFNEWQKSIPDNFKQSLGYVDQTIYHLWHGQNKNRQYWDRHFPLRYSNFDPKNDIRINTSGAWEWASNKPLLHKSIAKYFYNRKDDEF